jgi:hypothetical protein
VANGYNIIIGEMGSVNKNNTIERNEYARYYIKNARKFHMSCVLWDNGDFDNTKGAAEVFGLFQREQLTWFDNDAIDLQVAYASLPFEEVDSNEIFSIDLVETFNKARLVKDDFSKDFYDFLSAEQISEEIGMGWNLGNALDAFDDSKGQNQGLQSETCWGNPYTTEEMIKFIAN